MLYTQRFIRIFVGLLGLSSVIAEIVALIQRGTFDAGNFFSFFTILSNIIAGIVLLLLGILGPKAATAKISSLRGAATLYMIMTGVIFALLLSGLQGVAFTVLPWDNIVLHYIVPAYFVIDWLFFGPRVALARKQLFLWILFPLGYVAYSLIRGPIVQWYPYPFLNPAQHGYPTLFLTVAVLAVFVILIGLGMIMYQNWRVRKG